MSGLHESKFFATMRKVCQTILKPLPNGQYGVASSNFMRMQCINSINYEMSLTLTNSHRCGNQQYTKYAVKLIRIELS